MSNLDWTIRCPYCGCASSLYGWEGEGYLEHHCQQCGHRRISFQEAAVSWVRAESARRGAPDALSIDPMRRRDGVWVSRWTGRPVKVEPMPEDLCDRFDSVTEGEA